MSTTVSAPPWSPVKRLSVLLTLCVVAALNLIDRQLITILLEPIKRDLHATDTTMGLLTGLSFALVYATAALPIARWSDRTVRRDVISLCLLVWSGMTMFCGVAQSYWQLATARMTQTIAAPRMRGMAAAIVSFCLNLVGYGLGPLLVGVLNDHLGTSLGVQSVRYSLLILLSGCLVAAWISFAVNASVREDLAAAGVRA